MCHSFANCSFGEREAFAVCEALDPNKWHTKHIVDTGTLEHILRAPEPPHGVGVCLRRRCIGHIAVPPAEKSQFSPSARRLCPEGSLQPQTRTVSKLSPFFFPNSGVMKSSVDVSSPMCALFFLSCLSRDEHSGINGVWTRPTTTPQHAPNESTKSARIWRSAHWIF